LQNHDFWLILLWRVIAWYSSWRWHLLVFFKAYENRNQYWNLYLNIENHLGIILCSLDRNNCITIQIIYDRYKRKKCNSKYLTKNTSYHVQYAARNISGKKAKYKCIKYKKKLSLHRCCCTLIFNILPSKVEYKHTDVIT
jgi:hypothetical protein